MARRLLARRSVAVTASVVAAGALATVAGSAGAQPQPTIHQVQATISHLTSLEDQAVQQYDASAQQLAAARQRLTMVNREVKTDQAKFASMRTQIAQIATTAYESGTLNSMGALLTSNNPQAVLNQASVLMQLSTSRSAQVNQFIAAARQLEGARQTAIRTEQGIAALNKQRLARKQSINSSLKKKKAILATLTAQQRQQQKATTVGSGSSAPATAPATFTGSVSGQAAKAVAFAYMVLNDHTPYVYGGTGPPGPSGGYDCSGLVQAAWAAAGVSIPRDTYSQVAALPSVPTSAIQPGDLLFFDGNSHVGIYVGHGMLIDAPQPGQYVEIVSLSSPWYAQGLDSAARP
jgi:cell wall-associated NlpC family hydrolase